MNKQDEALLAEAARSVEDLALGGAGPSMAGSSANLIHRLAKRMRELLGHKEPLADGYYWIRANGPFLGWRHAHNEEPSSIGRVFILEKNQDAWCSICNESPYARLPDSFEVLGPVAPWVDPKYDGHPPFDEQGRPLPQNQPTDGIKATAPCPSCGAAVGQHHGLFCDPGGARLKEMRDAAHTPGESLLLADLRRAISGLFAVRMLWAIPTTSAATTLLLQSTWRYPPSTPGPIRTKPHEILDGLDRPT